MMCIDESTPLELTDMADIVIRLSLLTNELNVTLLRSDSLCAALTLPGGAATFKRHQVMHECVISGCGKAGS